MQFVQKQTDFLKELHLTEGRNTGFKRICARFRSGELFKKRLDDQTQLEKKQKEVKSLDANRIKSILF